MRGPGPVIYPQKIDFSAPWHKFRTGLRREIRIRGGSGLQIATSREFPGEDKLFMNEIEKTILEFRQILNRLKIAINRESEKGETEIQHLDRRVDDLFTRIVEEDMTDPKALLVRMGFLVDYIANSCDNDGHILNLCELITRDGKRMEKMFRAGNPVGMLN
jgi:hypothetical protein